MYTVFDQYVNVSHMSKLVLILTINLRQHFLITDELGAAQI